jgi:rare lipoprotein A
MPEGRPYSLGNSSADMASINATSEMSASSRSRSRGQVLQNPRAVSYENDRAAGLGARSGASYAPLDPHGPSEVLSARGLY